MSGGTVRDGKPDHGPLLLAALGLVLQAVLPIREKDVLEHLESDSGRKDSGPRNMRLLLC